MVPIPLKTKAPVVKGWQALRLRNADDLVSYFSDKPSNIGVLLGEPSGNLVDIDIDILECVPFCDAFLTPTATFGRKSKPRTHRFYITQADTKKFTYKDLNIIEIRSTGAQTVLPGSVHPSDEKIEWAEGTSAPVETDAALLPEAVGWCAAGALLSREWPTEAGSRNVMFMALVGGLMNSGWNEDSTKLFIRALCSATQDDETEDRLKIVKATYGKKDGKRTGWTKLGEHLDKDLLHKVREWLDKNVDEDGAFELNDLGNAKRFATQYVEKALYNEDTGKWMLWTGKLWREDKEAREARLLGEGVRESIKEEMLQCFNVKRRKQLGDHRDRLASKGQLDSMLELAKDKMFTSVNQLDTHKWKFNCNNGTIDLKTGKLCEFSGLDKITRMSPVDFKPKAKAPRWELFLQEIFLGNQNIIDFVQKVAGYSLVGEVNEQAMLILYGSGRNGKSKFLGALRNVFSDSYSAAVDSSSLMERKNAESTNDLARLKGIRLVTTTETSNSRFDEERIKKLTSDEPMVVRFLYREFFEFTPEFTIWLACNHKPNIYGTDDGIWRRLHLVPFSAKFEGASDDKNLPAKLAAEAEGILQWLVRGCLLWQKEGLTPPDDVKAATKDYREGQDTLTDFIQNQCVVGPKVRGMAGAIYAQYQAWARESGLLPMSKPRLTLILKERFNAIIEGQKILGVGVKHRSQKGDL